MKKPKSITVIGKRWFDKVNGNTYCSSQVYFDGKLVLKVPFEYGYGSYYIQNAADKLDKAGLIKLERYSNGGHQALWAYCSENDIVLNDQVFDGLKRDCIAWGKNV